MSHKKLNLESARYKTLSAELVKSIFYKCVASSIFYAYLPQFQSNCYHKGELYMPDNSAIEAGLPPLELQLIAINRQKLGTN